jgi:hypothetical protein
MLGGAPRDHRLHAAAAVEAASWLADRGFGRPHQTTLLGEAEPEIMPPEISEEELAAEFRRRLTLLEGSGRADR